ncbi:MAG TPA: hemolysin family protein, partial [Thermoanaerobaculaceae bacterium]|nr:hemolysin family protein [Thermoanaerobaculaceae bacterium]
IVRQVQIPRTDVVFLPDTLRLEEVEERVLASGYSRFPVFHGRDDNVVGFLLAKELLRPQARQGDWRKVLQPALFVPETKRVVELLREMRDRRVHVALAVDEYGAIAGLVSLEDLIEMIVGDIQDESDTVQPSWEVAGDGAWLVRGSLAVERLAHLTGRHLAAAPDYTSVAGLLLALAGRVPATGSRFEADGLVFEVTMASPARIEQVRVTLAPGS